MRYTWTSKLCVHALLYRHATSFSPNGPLSLVPRRETSSARYHWLKDFFEPPSSSGTSREIQFPEQYAATYEMSDVTLEEDNASAEAKIARLLLKSTQLESRPLQLVYDAQRDGWSATAFHKKVDGKGASIVFGKTKDGKLCGGYNPKGWASLGGARPSVAAFLFYERQNGTFQKLQKVGGGGLACSNDDPGFGICLGADGLVIPLRAGGSKRMASSKLGPYYERGPEDLSSLFRGATELKDLKVLVGQYRPDEEIPYSGGVLDMTSG